MLIRLALTALSLLPIALQGAVAPNLEEVDRSLVAWRANVVRLSAEAAKAAAYAIPELALLTAEDWILVAKDANFQSELETRRTLQLLRRAAKNRFAKITGDALEAYAQSHSGRLPKLLEELAPLMKPAPPAEAFKRYKQTGSGAFARGKIVIEEQGAADPWFDEKIAFGAGANSTMPVQSDAADVLGAIDRFVKASGTRPAKAADLAPFLKMPGGREISAAAAASIFNENFLRR